MRCSRRARPRCCADAECAALCRVRVAAPRPSPSPRSRRWTRRARSAGEWVGVRSGGGPMCWRSAGSPRRAAAGRDMCCGRCRPPPPSPPRLAPALSPAHAHPTPEPDSTTTPSARYTRGSSILTQYYIIGYLNALKINYFSLSKKWTVLKYPDK